MWACLLIHGGGGDEQLGERQRRGRNDQVTYWTRVEAEAEGSLRETVLESVWGFSRRYTSYSKGRGRQGAMVADQKMKQILTQEEGKESTKLQRRGRRIP